MSEVITIDGPTASGKSTIGCLFAQKIGFEFIDSGAIYRCGCLEILDKKISLDDDQQIGEVYRKLDIIFKTIDSKQTILLNGIDVTEKLHSPEITAIVPIVAAKRVVRDAAQVIQVRVGRSQDTVMAGRDIGTIIFPEAKLKFYITASAEVRAKRRYMQFSNTRKDMSYEKILEEIQSRDLMDMTREVSPLKVPEGARVIDTSNMTIDMSVGEMFHIYTFEFCLNLQ